jgi:thiol-disulfide isomerase/thioredoxin
VAGVAAVFGIAVYFVSMLKTAHAREVQAACTGLAPTGRSPTFEAAFPTAAKEFSAQDARGNMVSLSDFRGKVVLVNFWASYCKTCAAEKPTLNRLQEKHGDELAILALASDREWEPVRKKLAGGSPLQILLDPPQGDDNFGAVAKAYGIKAVPETFVVDKHGVARYYIVNKRDWTSGIAQTCIESLIRE